MSIQNITNMARQFDRSGGRHRPSYQVTYRHILNDMINRLAQVESGADSSTHLPLGMVLQDPQNHFIESLVTEFSAAVACADSRHECVVVARNAQYVSKQIESYRLLFEAPKSNVEVVEINTDFIVVINKSNNIQSTLRVISHDSYDLDNMTPSCIIFSEPHESDLRLLYQGKCRTNSPMNCLTNCHTAIERLKDGKCMIMCTFKDHVPEMLAYVRGRKPDTTPSFIIKTVRLVNYKTGKNGYQLIDNF